LGIAVLSGVVSVVVSFGVAGYQSHEAVKQASEAQLITAVGELEQSTFSVVKDGTNWYFSLQCGTKTCPHYTAPRPTDVTIDEDRLEAASYNVTDDTLRGDASRLVYDVQEIRKGGSYYTRLNLDLATLLGDCESLVTAGK
jgi:hypothetical protein